MLDICIYVLLQVVIILMVLCYINTAAIRLQELSLSLALKCLSFDFVGTSIDESSEEFGTVQVPLQIYNYCYFCYNI